MKSMGFFIEPTTIFLAIILTFILAKIVSFAVSGSDSDTDENTVACPANEDPAGKELTLARGLRVKSAKDKTKVKFVDDVVIRRLDHYEGSGNLELMDGFKSAGEKSVDEKLRSGVEQFGETDGNQDFGEKVVKEQCFDAGAEEKGSETDEMLIENEITRDNEDGLATSVLKSEKEWYGLVGCDENTENVRLESVNDEDDDWEGIERSELEKVFAEAVNYLEYGGKVKDKEGEDNKLAKLGNDVQMELYGLHKVAVEGPCHGPQPMALKVAARAKWNAWQKLGSMSQEAAMEQYIRVLSSNIPDWMHDYCADSSKVETICKISDPEPERELEVRSIPIGDSSNEQSSADKDDTV